MNETWIDPEERAYPNGGFTRRGRVRIVENTYNAGPRELPYGEIRAIRCSIPDTYFSIPARFRFRGKTYTGFVSVGRNEELVFTPYGAANGATVR